MRKNTAINVMKKEEFEDAQQVCLKYLRMIAACAMSQRAKTVINTYQKALVYGKLGKAKSDAELAKIVKAARRTVTDWISDFVKHGLAEKRGHTESPLFTLEELDIDLSYLKSKIDKTTEKEDINVKEKTD